MYSIVTVNIAEFAVIYGGELSLYEADIEM